MIPLEGDPRQSAHGPDEALRTELIAMARDAGLLTPHASRELGGLGLSHRAKAIVFEEAGYSPLGPIAMNIHAPDEGNMHLMEVGRDAAQKERWLQPLVAGTHAFVLCDDRAGAGAGSDPSMLQTTARSRRRRLRDQRPQVAHHRRRRRRHSRSSWRAWKTARATMFLADMDPPGIVHRAPDGCASTGASPAATRVAEFDEPARARERRARRGRQGLRVRAGAAGARAPDALHALARARRGARTTSRATTRARARRSASRWSSTKASASCSPTTRWICTTARLRSGTRAWLLDQAAKRRQPRIEHGEGAVARRREWRVVDRCVQVLGGQGVTDETIVARIFRDMRAFRIYDGPSEVHRWSIARRIGRRVERAAAARQDHA